MGLGPPVCQHCQVLGEHLKEAIPIVHTSSTRTANMWTHWVCPICGETDLQDSAGLSGDWQKYIDNEKFLRFITNKVNNEDI